ncbi:hypothetical protein PsorP6_006406 [Peronosclerospora sorghi]|uniref:Uncharacterized protein n=1 Tax=Peronosclerospora sorghi TaxID=230839 RepID=A0ACC0W5D4_9STRA|nr:hypothetical protein PsorP6_006406 [Peronosclerospora sorghi]
MVHVSDTYEVPTDYVYDEAQPPDVDIVVYDDQGIHVTGFMEDSELVTTQAVKALMTTHKLNKLKLKRHERLSYEDLLATIHFLPAYLRHMYKLPPAWLDGTHSTPAFYSATRGMDLPENFTDPLDYLRTQYEGHTAAPIQLFDYIFPDDKIWRAVLSSAMVNLFLMFFSLQEFTSTQ